jgi:hypothetical protein
MADSLDPSRILELRKLTRAIAELLQKQLQAHLVTLSPLMQPRLVFGRHVRSSSKQAVKGEDATFKQMQQLYSALIGKGPYQHLPEELGSPLDIINTSPVIAPAEYRHVARTEQGDKTITMKSPLKWVTSYKGFEMDRLRDLIASRETAVLGQCAIHCLVMHVTLSKLEGIGSIFTAMRFPLSTGKLEGFGELPITFMESPITTVRPPDEVIIQTTEIAGTSEFEEIVSVEGILNLQDPLRTRMLDLAQQVGCELQ